MLRSILIKPKTLQELSEELGLAFITVNKLVAELSKKKIINKFTLIENRANGRPRNYICLNPEYYCALITIVDDEYVVKRINAYSGFDEKKYFSFATNFDTLSKTDSLLMVRAFIGQDNPYCLGMYLVSENFDDISDVRKITKYKPYELLVDSFSDDDRVVFIDYFGKKILINHGKARFVKLTREQIHDALNVDEEYIVDEKNENTVMNLALRCMCEKKLEEKI